MEYFICISIYDKMKYRDLPIGYIYILEKLLKLGVDGVITDYSLEIVKLKEKYKDYNELENKLK